MYHDVTELWDGGIYLVNEAGERLAAKMLVALAGDGATFTFVSLDGNLTRRVTIPSHQCSLLDALRAVSLALSRD